MTACTAQLLRRHIARMRRSPPYSDRHKISGLQAQAYACAPAYRPRYGAGALSNTVDKIFSGAFRGLPIAVVNPINRSDEILSTEPESTSCNLIYTRQIIQLVSVPWSGSPISASIPAAAKLALVRPTKTHPTGLAIDSSNGGRAVRQHPYLHTTTRGSPVEYGQQVVALSQPYG